MCSMLRMVPQLLLAVEIDHFLVFDQPHPPRSQPQSEAQHSQSVPFRSKNQDLESENLKNQIFNNIIAVLKNPLGDPLGSKVEALGIVFVEIGCFLVPTMS